MSRRPRSRGRAVNQPTGLKSRADPAGSCERPSTTGPDFTVYTVRGGCLLHQLAGEHVHKGALGAARSGTVVGLSHRTCGVRGAGGRRDPGGQCDVRSGSMSTVENARDEQRGRGHPLRPAALPLGLPPGAGLPPERGGGRRLPDVLPAAEQRPADLHGQGRQRGEVPGPHGGAGADGAPVQASQRRPLQARLAPDDGIPKAGILLPCQLHGDCARGAQHRRPRAEHEVAGQRQVQQVHHDDARAAAGGPGDHLSRAYG
mmetsp:Transcript_13603/g.38716  ORF Transcript_13603/g.38716 Transcript_13603/m.38716 type:complete len:259 (-) Transcript_13603:3303-4079(-)